MRRLLAALLFLGATAPVEAAITRYRYAHTHLRLPSLRIPQFVVCDLEAELPTVDVGEGDLAYAKNSAKLFKRTGAAWVEVGGGSGAPFNGPA